MSAWRFRGLWLDCLATDRDHAVPTSQSVVEEASAASAAASSEVRQDRRLVMERLAALQQALQGSPADGHQDLWEGAGVTDWVEEPAFKAQPETVRLGGSMNDLSVPLRAHYLSFSTGTPTPPQAATLPAQPTAPSPPAALPDQPRPPVHHLHQVRRYNRHTTCHIPQTPSLLRLDGWQVPHRLAVTFVHRRGVPAPLLASQSFGRPAAAPAPMPPWPSSRPGPHVPLHQVRERTLGRSVRGCDKSSQWVGLIPAFASCRVLVLFILPLWATAAELGCRWRVVGRLDKVEHPIPSRRRRGGRRRGSTIMWVGGG